MLAEIVTLPSLQLPHQPPWEGVGFRFFVSQTTCSGIGKGPTEISVFAARTGLRQRRTLIFKYERMHDGSRNAEPVIMRVDDRP